MPTYIGLGITPERREILATEGGASVTDERGRPLLAFSGNNDLTLDATGNLRMVTDAEAVGEHARQRLQFFSGEDFIDPRIGVPWFEQVLGFSGTRPQVSEAIVKRVILQTPGVTGLSGINTTFDRAVRGMRVSDIQVETEFDETVEV